MDATKVTSIAMVGNTYKQHVSAQTPARQANNDTPQQSVINSRDVADSVQVRSSASLKNLDTSRAIEQMHASLNQLAKGVRETNESVNKAVGLTDAMKNNLQEITKNYPPFPVDSKERNERLMEYTSLRKELISLMVPPPPPAVYEKVKHMWSALFDDSNGQLQANAVPQLDTGSSDSQVKEVSQALDKTSSRLGELSDKVTQALLQP